LIDEKIHIFSGTNSRKQCIVVLIATTIWGVIMDSPFLIQPLVDLGLTSLESEIYAYLLVNSPATGYRVAKDTGKPTANTYKAIQSLRDKGGLIIEDSTNRLCRAVPMGEFLDVLERRFFRLKKEAEKDLSGLKPAPDDERIYYLHTPDQVFERFRQMLRRCEYIALFDLFPLTLDRMRRDIESEASRGIRIAVKVYRQCDIHGVEIVHAQDGEKTIQRWPGQWANGIVDGREHLLAFLSRDGTRVLQAVWSAHTYTSWIYHSSLMYELLHGTLSGRFEERTENTPLPEDYLKLKAMNADKAPGYWTLQERFGKKEEER
jgi:sugar-specific transcriptional regulator TrmB